MTSIANPWTNKTKIRGEGMLNGIMDKYLNPESEKDEYKQLKNKKDQEQQ